MNKLLLILTSSLSLTFANGQTNVSGGIFSNTTWTLANSPYIVTGSVVVFPGVTLTIQPGATVKFNSGTILEIRQANLIAVGTVTDSITFTSNSGNSPSSWGEIYLNGNLSYNIHRFDYCNFKYANNGINNASGLTYDTLRISNSNFNYNYNGIYGGNGANIYINNSNFRYNSNYGYGLNQSTKEGILNNCNFSNNNIGLQIDQYHTATNCTVNSNLVGLNDLRMCKILNCTISNNQTGIISAGDNLIQNSTIDSNIVRGIKLDRRDTLMSCQIKNNGTGAEDIGWTGNNLIAKCIIENNGIGLKIEGNFDTIYCNRICNNTSYGLYYVGSPNITFAHNYWCTADSASTEPVIYDGYDNINYGLVFFMPIDSVCPPSNPTSINDFVQTNSHVIFPNPFSTQTTLQTDIPLTNATLTVDNCRGQTVKQINYLSGKTFILNRDNLPIGLYFIRLSEDNKMITTTKIVITD